jgi:TolB protein
MTIRLHTRVASGVAFAAVAMLVACSEVDAPDTPEQIDAASYGLIVSEPLLAPSLSVVQADRSAAAARIDQEVSYVSLPRGQFQSDESAVISNLMSGASLTAPLVDGGFDPVAIPAAVGDTLEIAILNGSGGVTIGMVSEVFARVPPGVVRTDPDKEKVDVLFNQAPIIIFSEPMDGRTVTDETIQLLLDGQPVEGSVVLSGDGLRAEFTPAALAPGRSYTLIITTGVADLAGDPLEQRVEVSFATPPEGVIAFGRFLRGDIETSAIYRMNLRGGPARLTVGGAAAWSPDGSKIAFMKDGDMYVMNADGTGAMNLTHSGGFEQFPPRWSRDGSKIAYTVREGRGIPYDWDIYVVNADGSDQVKLTHDPAGDFAPTWSPDGSKIAFASDREAMLKIHVMNADGSDVVKLNDYHAYAAAWSPDGSKIAFTHPRIVGGDQEIYVMNADGTGVVNLTQHPATDRWPAWSPDGTKIVFSSWRHTSSRGDEPYDIYLMHADGSYVQRITASDEFSDSYPHWRP